MSVNSEKTIHIIVWTMLSDMKFAMIIETAIETIVATAKVSVRCLCVNVLGNFGISIVITSLFGSLPIKIRSILIYTSYVSENNKGHKEK